MSVADLRREYTLHGLTEADADRDPFAQFRIWFDQALAGGVMEPNAMTVATATADGRPAARVMLLKGFDEHGFVFFTNQLSRKGRELAANPRAALLFWWPELERQVRIEGTTSVVSPQEADAYFASRPLESQLGAWASPQSATLADRAELERWQAEQRARFAGGEVPRPPHWGGYRVRPHGFEFWQGRPGRLHDRLSYVYGVTGWELQRLAP